jgi:hypothetical protein
MIYQATGWRYYWRRYLGWFPVQFCMVCGRAYWGGLPRLHWRPWMMDSCSNKCADEEIDSLLHGGGSR